MTKDARWKKFSGFNEPRIEVEVINFLWKRGGPQLATAQAKNKRPQKAE